MKIAEKEHLDRVARIGCIVCLQHHGVHTPAQIHHLLGIKYRATGKKASNFHVLPLCHAHHQGEFGVHRHGLRAWERMFGTQEELLQSTNILIGEVH